MHANENELIWGRLRGRNSFNLTRASCLNCLHYKMYSTQAHPVAFGRGNWKNSWEIWTLSELPPQAHIIFSIKLCDESLSRRRRASSSFAYDYTHHTCTRRVCTDMCMSTPRIGCGSSCVNARNAHIINCVERVTRKAGHTHTFSTHICCFVVLGCSPA